MHQNNTEDIHSSNIGYMNISLITDKIKVLVVGGGRAGYIKARSFSIKGCSVHVLSKDFAEEFKVLKKDNIIEFIEDEYKIQYIYDKHIIVIATDDEEINRCIAADCNSLAKIYLTCSNFKNGLFAVPVQVETEESVISVSTKSGSPRTSLFISDIIKETVREYDGFIGYVSILRENLRGSAYKGKVMDFVNTKDFYNCFRLGTHEAELRKFYGGSGIEA